MSLLREAVEKRRSELIDKLIQANHFKKGQQHLYELSLTELEREYFRIQYKGHPHSGEKSIQWKNF